MAMNKTDTKAKKFMGVSMQTRRGPSVPKGQAKQPKNMGKTSGQVLTSMVAKVIKGPDQGDG